MSRISLYWEFFSRNLEGNTSSNLGGCLPSNFEGGGFMLEFGGQV